MNEYEQLIFKLRKAEAHYQTTHAAAEGTPIKSPERAERDRAESAVKSLRAEIYLVAAAAVERAAQAATKPIYLQPAGLSERVEDVDLFAGDPSLPF